MHVDAAWLVSPKLPQALENRCPSTCTQPCQGVVLLLPAPLQFLIDGGLSRVLPQCGDGGRECGPVQQLTALWCGIGRWTTSPWVLQLDARSPLQCWRLRMHFYSTASPGALDPTTSHSQQQNSHPNKSQTAATAPPLRPWVGHATHAGDAGWEPNRPHEQ